MQRVNIGFESGAALAVRARATTRSRACARAAPGDGLAPARDRRRPRRPEARRRRLRQRGVERAAHRLQRQPPALTISRSNRARGQGLPGPASATSAHQRCLTSSARPGLRCAGGRLVAALVAAGSSLEPSLRFALRARDPGGHVDALGAHRRDDVAVLVGAPLARAQQPPADLNGLGAARARRGGRAGRRGRRRACPRENRTVMSWSSSSSSWLRNRAGRRSIDSSVIDSESRPPTPSTDPLKRQTRFRKPGLKRGRSGLGSAGSRGGGVPRRRRAVVVGDGGLGAGQSRGDAQDGRERPYTHGALLSQSGSLVCRSVGRGAARNSVVRAPLDQCGQAASQTGLARPNGHSVSLRSARSASRCRARRRSTSSRGRPPCRSARARAAAS